VSSLPPSCGLPVLVIPGVAGCLRPRQHTHTHDGWSDHHGSTDVPRKMKTAGNTPFQLIRGDHWLPTHACRRGVRVHAVLSVGRRSHLPPRILTICGNDRCHTGEVTRMDMTEGTQRQQQARQQNGDSLQLTALPQCAQFLTRCHPSIHPSKNRLSVCAHLSSVTPIIRPPVRAPHCPCLQKCGLACLVQTIPCLLHDMIPCPSSVLVTCINGMQRDDRQATSKNGVGPWADGM